VNKVLSYLVFVLSGKEANRQTNVW